MVRNISNLGVTISRRRFTMKGMPSKDILEWEGYHVSWVILISLYLRHKDKTRGVIFSEEPCHKRKDKVRHHINP